MYHTLSETFFSIRVHGRDATTSSSTQHSQCHSFNNSTATQDNKIMLLRTTSDITSDFQVSLHRFSPCSSMQIILHCHFLDPISTFITKGTQKNSRGINPLQIATYNFLAGLAACSSVTGLTASFSGPPG